MSRMRLALGISVACHAAALAALILLTNTLPPPLDQPPQKRFEIALNQPTARVEPARAVEPPPQPETPVTPETAKPVPPEPEHPVAAAEIPPAPEPVVPVVTATEPPPPPKPVVRPKPPPKRVVRQPEPLPQLADLPPPVPAPMPPPVATLPMRAPVAAAPTPAPAPRPELAANYRAMLSGWFESHKRYPNSARENAEQGNAVVHFRVDSAGRILDFGLSRSTGYADLDNGIAEMMRGAQLPAFPPGLTVSYLDVAVTLRFSLTR